MFNPDRYIENSKHGRWITAAEDLYLTAEVDACMAARAAAAEGEDFRAVARTHADAFVVACAKLDPGEPDTGTPSDWREYAEIIFENALYAVEQLAEDSAP